MSNEAVFKTWKSNGEMTLDMAKEIEGIFDELMESELEQVDVLLSEDKAEAAFIRLALLTSFINAVASKRPSIINKLKKRVKKVNSHLKRIGKKLGADRFRVNVGVPVGVSVSLYFPI